MAEKSKGTSAKDRQISYYPRGAQYRSLVEAYSHEKGISCSAVVDSAVRSFFNAMPPQERERLLRQAKNRY